MMFVYGLCRIESCRNKSSGDYKRSEGSGVSKNSVEQDPRNPHQKADITAAASAMHGRSITFGHLQPSALSLRRMV